MSDPRTKPYQFLPDYASGGDVQVRNLLSGDGVAVFFVEGDPNGSVPGVMNQLALDIDTGTLWQNTDDATAWTVFATGGGGGVTGSGEPPAIPVWSSSSELASSAASDDGELFRVTNRQTSITTDFVNGSDQHAALLVRSIGTAVTDKDGGIQSFQSSVFDIETDSQSISGYFGNTATKAVGVEAALTNHALLVTCTGGDTNYAYRGLEGSFRHDRDGSFGELLTLNSLAFSGGASAVSVSPTGVVNLGAAVQDFTVDPSAAGSSAEANVRIGGAYANGAQLTTKNQTNVSICGIDIGIDTTIAPAAVGGLSIWRGANGGFGGAVNAGLCFAYTSTNFIIGADTNDLCLFNTAVNRRLLVSSDGTGYTCGLSLDKNGVATAKVLRTGNPIAGTGASWTSGTGAPVAPGSLGDMYSRVDGGVGSTLYVWNGVWTPIA